MTTADEIDRHLSSITPAVRKWWASPDAEVSAKGRRLVAEILAEKLGIVGIQEVNLSDLNRRA